MEPRGRPVGMESEKKNSAQILSRGEITSPPAKGQSCASHRLDANGGLAMAIVHFLIWTACAAVQEPSESDRNQDQRGNRTIELRVYFNALTPPKTAADQKDVPPEDLSLLMAITSSPNKAKTYVMERVALKEGEAPASGQRSQVRKLEGTAYYARLAAVGAEPPAKNGSGKATPQEPAPAEAKGDTESKEPK